MDLSGKGYSPAQHFLQNTSSLVSAFALGSSLVTGPSPLTTSLYTGTSHTLTSPGFSGSFRTSISPSHTSYSNGHSIAPHRQIEKASNDAAAKSHLYASPAPVFNRHKDSFPYGISGVPMPNYGYHGDVYQFTSNGYPRKSRTCSYCGKVFTRSTTRRYHEKRCPLLRAAVSSYMGEDNSGAGASTSQPRGRAGELSTHSYKGQGGQSLGPSSISGINRCSDPQELTTSVLVKSPTGNGRRASGESLLSGYQTSVIVKQEPNELEAMAHIAAGNITSSMSHNKHSVQSQELLSEGMLGFSPESNDSGNKHENTVSPGFAPGIDLSKSPSHTSVRDENTSVLSDDYIREPFISKNPGEDHHKIESDSEQRQGSHRSLEAYRQGKFQMDVDMPGGDVDDMDHTSNGLLDRGNDSEGIKDNNEDDMQDIHSDIESGEIMGTGENDDMSIIEKRDGKIFGTHKCGICGKCFDSWGKLHLHEQLHTKFKPYGCRFCGHKFAKAAQRDDHEKTHNGVDTTNICAVCGTTFTRKYTLKLHMRKWHQEGPWLCRHCGKASLTQMELKSHLYSHNLPKMERESLLYFPDYPNQEPPLDMQNDEEKIQSEGEPEQGMSDASGQPLKYPAGQEMEMCQECGRDFPKGYLRYHLKSHEAQKPYACPICAKRFGYKNNMKSHLKLHTGVKPFQCKMCGAKFTRGSTLRRHARRHGIIADSVWDLFIKPNYSKTGGGQTRTSNLDTLSTSNTDTSVTTATNQTRTSSGGGSSGEVSNYLVSSISPTSNHGSLYPLYASFGQIPGMPGIYPGLSATTSYLAQHLPHSSVYAASSHLPAQQLDALNLSVNKAVGDQQSDQSSFSNVSIERSRSRSRSLSGSESRPYTIRENTKPVFTADAGVQVRTCCSVPVKPPKSATTETLTTQPDMLEQDGENSPETTTTPQQVGSPPPLALVPYIVTSPSQRPSNLDSTSPALSVSSGKDYSVETISSLIGSGRMFKCFHCECYFSEYAMYRIHAKLHNSDYTRPFVCLICGEDCHDRVYFALHLSEHLR